MLPRATYARRVSPFGLLPLLLLLMSFGAVRGRGMNRVLASFPGRNFTNIVFSPVTNDVYVSATNVIFQLKASTLHKISQLVTGPVPDHKYCTNVSTACKQACDILEVSDDQCRHLMTSTIVRGMTLDSEHLYVCYNIRLGFCQRLKLTDIAKVVSNSSRPVVCSNTKTHVSMLVAQSQGKQRGLYLGVTRCRPSAYGNFNDVPTLTTRRLDNFDLFVEDIMHSILGAAHSAMDIRGQEANYFSIHFRYSFEYKQPIPGSTAPPTTFVYHLVVQPEARTIPLMVTRLGRFCSKDMFYRSYTEFSLRCIGTHRVNDKTEPIDYNIAESAYLGQAGLLLAERLGIDPEDKVLYVAFRSSRRNEGMGHTNKGGVCVYSMKELQAVYLTILKNCFLLGGRNIGPNHYTSVTKKCSQYHSDEKKKELNLGTCNDDRSNSPLSGMQRSESVVKTAMVEFDDTEVQSVRGSSVSNNYTVLLLGLRDGRLRQYEINYTPSGKPQRRLLNNLNLGTDPIIRLESSKEKNSVFALSKNMLTKVKLYDCSQYSSCETCQDAAQPYCGWCILASKCTTLAECHGRRNWIPYTHGRRCPRVQRVVPSGYQTYSLPSNSNIKLAMKVENVPFDLLEKYSQRSSRYLLECCFSPVQRVNALNATCSTNTFAFTRAKIFSTQQEIRCFTPTINCLPDIPPDSDHVPLKVSVILQEKLREGQPLADLTTVRKRSVILAIDWNVFNCRKHTNCTSCVQSRFGCDWCAKGSRCSYKEVRIFHCGGGIVSAGKAVECPRFSHASSVIRLPAGLKKKRSRIHLRLESKAPFMRSFACVLRCPGQPTLIAPTKIAKRKRYTNVCVYDRLDYKENVGKVRCSLDVQWNESARVTALTNKYLENPGRVSVELYKCQNMKHSCGECLIDLDPAYKCGWCLRGDSSQCTLQTRCPKHDWKHRNETCSHPQITEIVPRNATSSGAVTVTLRGFNLGQTFADIRNSVKLWLGSQHVPCHTQPEGYVPPRQIRCRLEYNSYLRTSVSGHFEVMVAHQYSGRSLHNFSFLTPTVQTVSPRSGPQSGGTRVCLRGTDLAIGSKRQVLWHFPGSASPKKNRSLPCRIISASNSEICCLTAAAPQTGKVVLSLIFDGNRKPQHVHSFSYELDPTVDPVIRDSIILSGGLPIEVTGSNLDVPASARVIVQRGRLQVFGACTERSRSAMTCFSPNVSALFPAAFPARHRRDVSAPSALGKAVLGLEMDGVRLAIRKDLEVFPDPIVYRFPGGELVRSLDNENARQEDTLKLLGRHLAGAIERADVRVRVGARPCGVIKVSDEEVICLLKQPVHDTTSLVTVTIGKKLRFELGHLAYRSSRRLSNLLIIGIGAGSFLLFLLVMCIVVCVCHRLTKERSKMKREMEREMIEMENKVSRECKEAFAELQMVMSEVTHALALASTDGQRRLPFRDYRYFCLKQLFPSQEFMQHPVVTQLEVPRERLYDFDAGFRKLSELMKNRTFILVTIRALEAQEAFNARDRSNFASLLSAALQSKMEYFTDLLKMLLSEFITHNISKHREKLLFRRSESVAEKMMANWLTFLLYDYLQDRAGEPLYLLTQAIWLQISSGPVDALTHESRYTLSDSMLIRESVSCNEERLIFTDPLGTFEECHSNDPDWELSVKVMDVDTISQVKEKILFTIYRHTAYSTRPCADDVDLELLASTTNPEKAQLTSEPRVMQDIDCTCELEARGNRPSFRRLNTLKHYMKLWGFKSGAHVKLTMRSNRCDTNSYKGENASSVVNSTSNLIGTLSEFDRPDGYMTGGGTLPTTLGNSSSYGQFATSQRFVQQNVNYHLVKPNDDACEDPGGRPSKMISVEAQLNRMLFTKKCIARYIDDFLKTVFAVSLDTSTGTDPLLPLCIKYMFDFLDDQARNHSVTDPEVVHVWKSNCLPLRFWVGVVKNPEFLFDVEKTPGVDASLGVVAQTLMESCSWSRNEPTMESPTTKLLFNQETRQLHAKVSNYYKDIKSIPAISDQEMNAHLIAHSNKHANDFDVANSFYTLYLQYISKYSKQISEALDADVSARRQRLASTLAEVHYLLGSTRC